MFTGLVEAAVAVRALRRQSGGALLDVEVPEAWGEVARGESICVSGVCLTVVPEQGAGALRFDVSGETLERSTLGALRPGDVVIALGAGDVNAAVRGLKARLDAKNGGPSPTLVPPSLGEGPPA